ncbi:hypothetical protein HQQ80_09775 [Microbacteriaceae bacterium VKM Ac-2855]|nr:hypothetical protein [Microbacteriaceae bacterium VKM Ac-2855]
MTTEGRNANLGYGIALAAFAGFLYLALVVCAFGVISLIADIDVIPDRSVGPIVGPVMTAIAVIATIVSMITLAARPTVMRILPPALVAGLAIYLLFLLSGGAMYAGGTGDAVSILVFAAEQAPRPFAIAVGVLCAAVHIVFLLLLARRDAGGTPPHWGWEGDERE